MSVVFHADETETVLLTRLVIFNALFEVNEHISPTHQALPSQCGPSQRHL